jgi:hypothetical protein
LHCDLKKQIHRLFPGAHGTLAGFSITQRIPPIKDVSQCGSHSLWLCNAYVCLFIGAGMKANPFSKLRDKIHTLTDPGKRTFSNGPAPKPNQHLKAYDAHEISGEHSESQSDDESFNDFPSLRTRQETESRSLFSEYDAGLKKRPVPPVSENSAGTARSNRISTSSPLGPSNKKAESGIPAKPAPLPYRRSTTAPSYKADPGKRNISSGPKVRAPHALSEAACSYQIELVEKLIGGASERNKIDAISALILRIAETVDTDSFLGTGKLGFATLKDRDTAHSFLATGKLLFDSLEDKDTAYGEILEKLKTSEKHTQLLWKLTRQ